MKINWQKTGKKGGDWFAKVEGYTLRAEKMDAWWWWAIYDAHSEIVIDFWEEAEHITTRNKVFEKVEFEFKKYYKLFSTK